MDVCVVGLGTVGSPLAAVLARKVRRARGVGLSRNIVDRLKRGAAPDIAPGLEAPTGLIKARPA